MDLWSGEVWGRWMWHEMNEAVFSPLAHPCLRIRREHLEC